MIEGMGGEGNGDSFWVEEINGEVQTPMRKKRRYRTKKKEYNGWGSTSLISFLDSIGIDTSKQMTQTDVAEIVTEYVKRNGLIHPTKKKRVVCDEKLHSLFGRKTISRLKIHDLLESHFAENCGESDDDFLFNSDDDENAMAMFETPKAATSERKSQSKKPVREKPKSCFAAIVPSNIKLVYLKRSLVEELFKDPETFETKVVGTFIRIRCDPNDYLQKNSHQLLQVTGIKKGSGMNGEILLQVSGFFRDISIRKLSDDNFTEDECEDLHRRVKDGLLKRPLIVDIEQTARALHVDITKHWLARELVLLQNQIDRANEKGWRRELDEYLERREKLKRPDEQDRLLHEIPEVIADDLESESKTLDAEDEKVEDDLQELPQTTCKEASLVTDIPKAVADGFRCKATELHIADRVNQERNSPKSNLSLSISSEVLVLNVAMNGTAAEQHIKFSTKNHGVSKTESNEARISEGPQDKPQPPSQPQVIELSDDDEDEQPSTTKQVSLAEQSQSLTWHYKDPQGVVQGPFSLTSLKRWSDASYFPPDFKVWKRGQREDEAALLVDILNQFFPI